MALINSLDTIFTHATLC